MLPKKNRLTMKDIQRIFKDGKFLNSPNLTFKFIRNTASLQSRISFIAPKSVAKGAIKRNLLRRRGYAAFKKYINKTPAGLYGAFIFGKRSLNIFGLKKPSAPVLDQEIKYILEKYEKNYFKNN